MIIIAVFETTADNITQNTVCVHSLHSLLPLYRNIEILVTFVQLPSYSISIDYLWEQLVISFRKVQELKLLVSVKVYDVMLF